MVIENRVWDRDYEWKATVLLGLGFGLVGLDRWIIAPLFPAMAADLGLTYQDLGLISGVLALAWGVSSVLVGHYSARVGHRRVLIPAIILFSLMAGLSGVAGGLASLLLLRTLMGLSEGAFTPISIAATSDAAYPRRRGLALGVMLSMFSLIGLGLGPVIATQLLGSIGSWRWVFVIVSIPGLVVAASLYVVLREPKHRQEPIITAAALASGKNTWRAILMSRNVVVSIVGTLGAMCGVFVLGALVPSYLVDFRKFSPQEMGFVMSALGFGGFIGQFGVPALSDWVGRKPMAFIGFAIASLLFYGFSNPTNSIMESFVLLGGGALCCFGLLALFTGPIPADSISPALTGTAIGLIVGAGEIFGGGIAPAIAGFIAQNYGIQNIFVLPFSGLTVGFLACFLLHETAPRKIAAPLAQA